MTVVQTRIDFERTSRVIPSNHSDPALEDLFDDDQEAGVVFDLDGATNDRLLAENDRNLGINRDELVFRVPNAHIVNAAFTHCRVTGGRFNPSWRGAWYASLDLETAIEEVKWHHKQWLREIDYPYDTVTKDQWLADFHGEFHDVRGNPEFSETYLHPDPSVGYQHGQKLAEEIMQSNGLGIVYPSVRHAGGTNIVCFRPALVDNVQKGSTIRFAWEGTLEPTVYVES